MTVRSTCFFRATFNAVQNGAVYTVPPGMTLIWKDIRLNNIASGAVNVSLNAMGAGGTPSVAVAFYQTTAGQVLSQELYVVLEGGDQVGIFSSAAGFQVWLSGSLLAGVAP